MLNYYLNCYIFLFLSFLFCILLLKYLDSSRCQARQYKKEFLERYHEILSIIDSTSAALGSAGRQELDQLTIECSYAISQYEFILENASLKQEDVHKLMNIISKLRLLSGELHNLRQISRNR